MFETQPVELLGKRAPSPAAWMNHLTAQPAHPDWVKLTDEAAAIAKEVLPTLEPPRTGPSYLRRRALSYKKTFENYVENRRRAKAGREDLLPLYLLWTLLRSCNFDCTYCDDHQGRRYPHLPTDGELDTDQALRLLEIFRTGTASVYFAGGEPTMRKDLPVLTRAARDLDFYPIIINTNGSIIDRRLKSAAWRTWLADTDIVIVSLDALDLRELRTMWAYKRPSEVLRNLLVLRELREPMRFKLMVNMVIQPGRIEHAREVMNLARDLDIWLCPVPVNIGAVVDGELTSDPEYRALATELLEAKAEGAKITGSPRMLRRLLFSEPLTCRNSLKPHVDHDGSLVWPCKAATNVSPEHINVLDFEDVESLYQHAVTKVDPTRFHGPAKNQCGGDCNWAQNYSTDAYANGLTDPAALLREVVGFLS